MDLYTSPNTTQPLDQTPGVASQTPLPASDPLGTPVATPVEASDDSEAVNELLAALDQGIDELNTIQAEEDAQTEAAIKEGEDAIAAYSAQLDAEEQALEQQIIDSQNAAPAPNMDEVAPLTTPPQQF